MKNIVSLLITGLMLTTSAVYADVNKAVEAMVNTSASVAVAFEEGLHFPLCGRVMFNEFINQSGPVSLQRGWLKLPKGTYQIYYLVQLQNSGEADVMQLWLTTKVPPCKIPKVISESSVQVGITAATPSLFPTVKASRLLTIKLEKTSIISLNYSTGGKACLSTISSDPTSTPNPFTLTARKIAE